MPTRIQNEGKNEIKGDKISKPSYDALKSRVGGHHQVDDNSSPPPSPPPSTPATVLGKTPSIRGMTGVTPKIGSIPSGKGKQQPAKTPKKNLIK